MTKPLEEDRHTALAEKIGNLPQPIYLGDIYSAINDVWGYSAPNSLECRIQYAEVLAYAREKGQVELLAAMAYAAFEEYQVVRNAWVCGPAERAIKTLNPSERFKG